MTELNIAVVGAGLIGKRHCELVAVFVSVRFGASILPLHKYVRDVRREYGWAL